ncbi:hypothetical protein D5F01_LYC11164 [Larimichthys crocea]|uniref:PiggyBac transposable element-derived protein domain-containing protein n=1 Tax=Larimichthys crocea TaxID=215358 RepID=A0A6G0IDS6_LARCR|nr:hypothetical protein D5F01_LYC11164 [Larimichthys crocea]
MDTMDQMVSNYSCQRRTRRTGTRPMVLWYTMLDVATLNAYTSFTAQHPGYMGGVSNARRLFIKELGKELVMPHMKRRMEGTPKLQKHIIEAMGRCQLKKQNPATTQPQESTRQEGQRKRKRCAICPVSRDRKVSSWCSQCTRYTVAEVLAMLQDSETVTSQLCLSQKCTHMTQTVTVTNLMTRPLVTLTASHRD